MTTSVDTTTGPSSADVSLQKAEWQQVLFAEQPRWSDLMRLTPSWPCRPLALRVYRNHAFEFIATAMQPFAAYAGLSVEIEYGDYDDSLGVSPAEPVDATIVWFDFRRYRERLDAPSLAGWLGERLVAMRSVEAGPILVTNWDAEDDDAIEFNQRLLALTKDLPGIYLCDLREIAIALGNGYTDLRASRFTGTYLSAAASTLIARRFGFRWLPGVLTPRLKAVAVDLDNTLYDGVLGEDGPTRLRLSEGHADLQRRLLRLRDDGIFLAAVSRNDPRDVELLWEARDDFPLRPEHLSAQAVSWDAKSVAMETIAQRLRIGVDAILFVDDNPGELASVASAHPHMPTLHATTPVETLRALDLFPGLWQGRASETDALRIADLQASTERKALEAATDDPWEYLRTLRARLILALNPEDQIDRLHELSTKTNQFNLALRRLSAVEVTRRVQDPEHGVVSIRLSDRLSDSGIVGTLFAHHDGDALVVDDLCISCRALGRQLEDVMISEAISLVLERLPASRVTFAFTAGPRNEPARSWLERFGEQAVSADKMQVTVDWDDKAREIAAAALPVTIEREGNEEVG